MNPAYSMLIAPDGTMPETNMEPVEQALVLRYFQKNAAFMEARMPEYFRFEIAGHYLCYTSHCVIECMRVHASDRKHHPCFWINGSYLGKSF